MIEIDFDGFQICCIDECNYKIDALDNVFQYRRIYQDDENCRKSIHGIKIYQDRKLINSAIVASWGGCTTIHSNCVLIDDCNILICCGDSIFCLELPSLDLLWHVKSDDATCLEIFSMPNGYIVHGELEITRLDKKGNVVWKISGADIFVTKDGIDGFEIDKSCIIAKDWNNDVYKISLDGEVISDTVKR